MDRGLLDALVKRKRAPGLVAPLAGGDVLGYCDPSASVAEVDERAMRVKAVISTVDLDRSGDVVVPQGCLSRIATYRRNPVVLLGHQELLPLPVGRSEDNAGAPGVDVEADRRVTAWCRFSQATQDACDVFRLVQEGTLRQASIGFIPHVATRLKKAHATDRDREGYLVEEWELVEWSWVVIADNQSCEAIRAHLSRGKITGKTLSPVLTKALSGYAKPGPAWANGINLKGSNMADETTMQEREDGEIVEEKAVEAPEEPVEEEAPEEVDDTPQAPLSAQVSTEVMQHIRDLNAYLDEVTPLIEQPKIAGHLGKLRAAADKIITDLHGVASGIHPDHDFGEIPGSEESGETEDAEEESTEEPEEKEADEEDDVETTETDDYETKGEDESDDTEAGTEADDSDSEEDENPADRYKASGPTAIKEAIDYINTALADGQLSKRGLKFHADRLAEALKVVQEVPAEEPSAELGDSERKQLHAAIKSLSRQLYLLTGKKVPV